MKAIAAERELFRACEIIFGPDLHVSREFLEYLQLAGIKSAYRRRAMETHPDRAALADEQSLRERHHLFHSVQQSYEKLLAFLDAREKGLDLFPSRPQPVRPHAARAETARPRPAVRKKREQPGGGGTAFSWHTEGRHQGALPGRPLLLGHFLYYSGLINWRTIIEALVWQRTQRPRLGELGIRFGLLAEADILHILRNRPPLTPFGEAALELQLLTEPQLRFLLCHQKQLQKKFGEFFLEKKIFTPDELRELLHRCQNHNMTIVRRMHGARIRF